MSDPKSTTKPPAVVAKRGLQTVRQRHQGRAFVNSSSLNADNQEWTGFSKPVPEQMKFVTQKNPAGKKKNRRATTKFDEDKQADHNKPTEDETHDLIRTESIEVQQLYDWSGLPCDEGVDILDPWITENANPQTASTDCSSIFTEFGTDTLISWTQSKDISFFDEDSISGLPYDVTEPVVDQAFEDCCSNHTTEQDSRYIDSYIKLIHLPLLWPIKTLHLIEDYPSENTRKSESLLSDPLARDCALSIGALFFFLESGEKDSTKFAFHCGRLCAILNQALSSEEARLADKKIVHSASSLAIVAVLLGNCNDWYLHLQGLQTLVGSLEALDPKTRTLIRKADLIGSIKLASEPVLPFIRFSEPVSCVIPAIDRQKTRDIIVRSLLGAGITASVVETFVALSHFIRAIDYALSADGRLKFKIDALAEDWFSIQHSFLTVPSPILPREEGLLVHATGKELARTDVESRPDRTGNAGALTTALRLAGLLCMALCGPKTTPYESDDLSVILSILLKHMRFILLTIRAQSSTVVNNSISTGISGGLSVVKARQSIIWLCLIAEFTWATSKNEGWRSQDLDLQYSIVGQLLAEVVGNTPRDIALLTTEDLQLCQILDLSRLMGVAPSNERERMLYILESAETATPENLGPV